MIAKLIGAAAVVAAVLSAPAVQAQQFINVLTGGTSGVYYPLGVAIGKIYSDKIANVKTQVQATKASVENLVLLQQVAASSPLRSAIRSKRPGKATRRPASRKRWISCAPSARSIRTTSRSLPPPTAASRRSPISRARASRPPPQIPARAQTPPHPPPRPPRATRL